LSKKRKKNRKGRRDYYYDYKYDNFKTTFKTVKSEDIHNIAYLVFGSLYYNPSDN